MQFELGKIHNVDAGVLLGAMESGSVDLCWFDPPYNVGKDYGTYKDDLPESEYRDWMQTVIEQARKIARRGIIIYVGSERTKLFWDLLPDAHMIPVHKRAVGVMKGNYFLQYHSMFSTAMPIMKTKDLWDDVRLPGEGYYFREERFDHPGLTAAGLTKKVLRHFTEKNDIVCDPFMGTGTTAICCEGYERRWIGSEINPNYVAMANERLERRRTQGVLDFDGQRYDKANCI
jgi:site-specific DNA-methyltransferase (adenine-specific)